MNTIISENTRTKELDGIRGMAITMVVIYHYFTNLLDGSQSKLYYIFISLSQYFYTGVDLFFVLSGFLLGGILIKNKSSKNYFTTFYLRRFCRILPIYYISIFSAYFICTIGIGKGTLWWFNDKVPFWTYTVFIQNIFMGLNETLGNKFIVNTWSLGLEEQFYILLPLIIYLLPKKWLPLLLSVCIIAAPIFRYHSTSYYSSFTFIYCRFDSLFSGVLIAMAVKNKRILEFANQYKKQLVQLLIGCFILSYLFTTRTLKLDYQSVGTWFAFVWSLFIFICVTNKDNFFSFIARNKYLVWIGLYSYGIYIYHEIVLGTLFFLLKKNAPQLVSISDFILVLSSLIISISIAYYSYQYLEKKFIAIGHKFNY